MKLLFLIHLTTAEALSRVSFVATLLLPLVLIITFPIATMTRTSVCLSAVLIGSASGFGVFPTTQKSLTELRMGLFDGVKDAFSAPALERSTLDSERETPIDRWMGWSVTSDNQQPQQQAGES